MAVEPPKKNQNWAVIVDDTKQLLLSAAHDHVLLRQKDSVKQLLEVRINGKIHVLAHLLRLTPQAVAKATATAIGMAAAVAMALGHGRSGLWP